MEVMLPYVWSTVFALFDHVAARVDVHLSTTEDFHGCPGNFTIRCGGDLASYPEQELEEEPGRRPPEPKIPIPCNAGESLPEDFSKTSTSLRFANHPLRSNDDWLWKGIC